MNLEKNSIITVSIDDYSHEGQGIAHYNNKTIFIKKAIINEKLRIKITNIKKNIAFAEIIEIIEKSKYRLTPKCNYEKCGACQINHMKYEEQVKLKEKTFKNTLNKILKENILINEIIKMEYPFEYRNKNSIMIEKSNNLKLGFYEEKSYNIVSIANCNIQKSINLEIISIIEKWIKKYNISVYDKKSKKGKLRQIVMRGEEEIMIAIISTNKNLEHTDKLIEELLKLNINISSILLNINKFTQNKLTKDTIILYGRDYIKIALENIIFKIKLDTFFQINTSQTVKLYNKVIELANLNKNDIVVDAYCGVGTISLFLAKKVKKVIGFELVENSVLSAIENAKENNINNVEFIVGDILNTLPKWQEKNSYDVLIVDPPRAGLENKFIKKILEKIPNKIVYISCNPATLSRDLNIFKKIYKIKSINPVDMFPQSYHLESVSLLEKI